MSRRSFAALIGLAGVARKEAPAAIRWGKLFEAPMLLLSIWIIIEWYLSAKGSYPHRWEIVTNWIFLIFFVTETILLTLLVRDKRRYLRSNWVNLLIIAVGIPLLWTDQPYAGALRSLRILLLFGFLFELSSTVRFILARNHLGLTLLVSFVVIVMAGTIIAAIDPAIATPWDGIWWAWVTVTTVGYGDIVPESPQGKVFGALLMLLGLSMFSLITANFSAFLITREEEEVVQKEEILLQKGEAVVGEEKRAIAKLEEIEHRLERLEQGLERLIERLPDDRSRDR